MVLTADYRAQKRGFVKRSLGEQKMPRGKGGGRPWSKDRERSAGSRGPTEDGSEALFERYWPRIKKKKKTDEKQKR